MRLAVFVRRAMFLIALTVVATCEGRAASSQAETGGSGTRVFDDCSGADWCPRMVSLPGGTYTMGSPTDEPGRFDDENEKSVTVGPFAIGMNPVTRGRWRAFVIATQHEGPRSPCAYALAENATWEHTGFAQDDSHPVVCVTWGEAQEYTRWLSSRTGHHYRLLTEAEWEYAARAGSSTAYPWGALPSHELANYGAEKCCHPATVGHDRWDYTSPVGSFPPNAFGLYDMNGNVTEWIETCADTLEKLPIPTGATGCTYRYARGGNYDDPPDQIRSAAKNLAPPPNAPLTIDNYRSSGFGFRVARDPDRK